MKKVRIGGGLGFYGDSFLPALEMILNDKVSYVAFEDLAELTLAILQKDRQRDPSGGFTKDFIPMLKLILSEAKKRGIKLITNAGGLNPEGAAKAALNLAKKMGLHIKIGLVKGDDLLGDLSKLSSLSHMETGALITEDIIKKAVFANAYIGAKPIVEALKKDVDIVITGRVADASLFLAPIVYEFGWSFDDLDKIAAGTTAGHLLECSTQVTGGNHGEKWWEIDDIDNIGYPIAEVHEDGALFITKTKDSGGIVNFDTVREQLLYEVHNPARYLTPDVTLNMMGIKLQETAENVVQVTGIKGEPKPEKYKMLISYPDGFMGQSIIGYSWPDALRKAKTTEKIVRKIIEKMKLPVKDIRAEYLGYNSFHGPLADSTYVEELNEIYLRILGRTDDKYTAEQISRIMVPLALSGPPTASGLLGFQRVRSLLGLWPTLIERELVDKRIEVKIMEV